jgi:hypothetical protein
MEILRNGEKEVFKFVTPSGVTAAVAVGIPREALLALRKKLLRSVRRDERARAAAKTPRSHRP